MKTVKVISSKDATEFASLLETELNAGATIINTFSNVFGELVAIVSNTVAEVAAKK